MWDEYNCAVVWTFFGIAFLWDWKENWPFQALWPLLSFPNLLAHWGQHFISIILRTWNSTAGIPSPPLVFFVAMLHKAHLTWDSDTKAFDYFQLSLSVMSDSSQAHGLQHARLPYPSPMPRDYSNSCALHWWCHPTILSSVIPFSSCLQSFPASGSFPMSRFFAPGGQSIGVSDSASVIPMNIQDRFPLDWLVGSLCSPRDSQESFPTPWFKSINSSVLSFLYNPTLTSIHDYWKNHSFD